MMLTSSIEDISDNGEGVVGQFAGYGLPFRFTRLDSTLQARIFLIDKPLNNSSGDELERSHRTIKRRGVMHVQNRGLYTG